MRNGIFSAALAIASANLLIKPASAQLPVGHDAFCGLPIFVYHTGMGAQASVWNGTPVIFIDPGTWQGDQAFLTFTIAHECGHHRLGHTLPQGVRSRMYFVAQQELQADCFAARSVT